MIDQRYTLKEFVIHSGLTKKRLNEVCGMRSIRVNAYLTLMR